MFTFPFNYPGTWAQRYKVFLFGGIIDVSTSVASIEAFDERGTAIHSSSLIGPRQRTAAARHGNGNIYVFGGNLSTAYYTHIHQFDGSTISITTNNPYVAYSDQRAVQGYLGSIFVYGGRDSSIAYTTVIRMLDVNGTYGGSGSTLGAPLAGMSVATTDNITAYIFGGLSPRTSIIQKHITSTGVRTNETAVLAAVNGYSAASNIGPNMWIFGGTDDATVLSTIQKYTGATISTEVMTLQRRGLTAATVYDDIYLAGGESNDLSPSSNIFKWNGTTLVGQSFGLTVARAYHSSSTLPT